MRQSPRNETPTERFEIREDNTNCGFRSYFLLVFALAAFALTASAQRLDGTLRGTVEDPSGAVIPEATVTATNQVTGSMQSTRTTSVGTYVFPNLLTGIYTVQVADLAVVSMTVVQIRHLDRIYPREQEIGRAHV